jgi:energy-coupling factor transporter ATP-binding protein EcfA2/uncharacterized Ntn-hydrolase superfamily protein
MTSSETSAPLLETWSIPISDGSILELEARAGQVITVVGANGSGKSALSTWMAQNTSCALRRVLAQRTLSFSGSGPSVNASERQSHTEQVAYYDKAGQSRWFDAMAGPRMNFALFDLLGSIQLEHQRVADLLYDDGMSSHEVLTTVGTRLFTVLNSVLERAGLLVEVRTTDIQSFSARHRTLGIEYPVSEMSDGERSALLLAAEVLTAPPGAVVMLDEPERHLHRSISARLIEAVIEARADCLYVVLTHDLELASVLSARPGTVLTTLGVEWSDKDPVSWTIRQVTADSPITEVARRAILGGRKRVLFVEGQEGSLDISLYGALFPDWALAPSGSCEAVMRNVAGLRTSDDYHWVQAVGIVDGDGRSAVERASLKAKGTSALSVSEIENLYYLPNVVNAVAEKQAEIQGDSVSKLVEDAIKAGLRALGGAGTLERLAMKLAKDELARSLLSSLPNEISEDDIEIRLSSPYPGKIAELTRLLKSDNYESLVREVPIRDTGFRNEVAKSLGFASVQRYQKAALVCVNQLPALAAALRHEVSDLTQSEPVDAEAAR